MDRSYYFSVHSSEILKEWANRLKMFRYLRGHKPQGTFYQEADDLTCKFSYKNENELLEFFNFIKFEPVIYESEPKQPKIIQCEHYQMIDRNGCPDIILGTKWVQQPGIFNLSGIRTSIWCEENYIRIGGKPHSDWTISETDILNAEKLEAILVSCNLKLIDPPVDDDHCLCPKYFPEMFC